MAGLFRKIRTFVSDATVRKTWIRWQRHSLAGTQPVIKLPFGCSIREFRHYNHYRGAYATVFQGSYRRDMKSMLGLIPERGTFIDVGANLGIFCMPVAVAKPQSSVHAFEPSPKTWKALNLHQDECGTDNLKLWNIALTDQNGPVSFSDNDQSPEQSKIMSQGLDETDTCEGRTFDDWCQENKIDQVDCMKIDVEGFEFAVLRGAKKMLSEKRIRAIILEIIPQAFDGMPLTAGEFIEEIEAYDYVFYLPDDNGKPGKRIGSDFFGDKVWNDSLSERNFIALPKS